MIFYLLQSIIVIYSDIFKFFNLCWIEYNGVDDRNFSCNEPMESLSLED